MPALEVSTDDGELWRLADQRPETFSMVVFYRGLHCPICSRYIKGLADSLSDFRERGVEAIAISTDDGERAVRARQDWGSSATSRSAMASRSIRRAPGASTSPACAA